MMRLAKNITALLLCIVSACSSKGSAPRISPEAAALFARADAPGTGGSLVIDLEALRELSQIKENPASQGVIAEIAGYMLVAGAVQLKDNASVGPLVAKAAALFAIFRQWDVWPRVHRVGLIASASTPWRTRRCWCSRCKAARPRRRRC
jgi:hypothetical protein